MEKSPTPRPAASTRIAYMKPKRRIWVVSYLYGQAQRLVSIHHAIAQEYQAGDQIVYLGNYLGRNPTGAEALDELLYFRRALMATAGTQADDVVYLKGRQEEHWRRLLQLHLERDPRRAYAEMVGDGLAEAIASYGKDPEIVPAILADGSAAFAKWVAELLDTQKKREGHYQLLTEHLLYAALLPGATAIVSAGVDPALPLEDQRDEFWARRQEPISGWTQTGVLVHGECPGMPFGVSLGEGGIITVNGGSDGLAALLLDESAMPVRIIEI
ncbi:hypothetical protein FACS1894186_0180 [Alphaproteobacteria bacterium]|nr:hypothetical protein FACS1894186_0180 [Alphaproteobacteria bacterium]